MGEPMSNHNADAAPQRSAAHRNPFDAAPDADAENLLLAGTTSAVDKLLEEFYGTFPWPWQPTTFTALDDPRFEAVMVNQDLGDWGHRTLPPDPSIWVAGCGTNQALHAALKFPEGVVLGSDVSRPPLELGRRNAARLGITNLELRQESINEVDYREQFDYVICTGVVHHNADPAATLARLSASLKPGGVLELMVYNRFHRALNTSFQKAVRILGERREGPSFVSDFELARSLARDFPAENQLAAQLAEARDVPDAEFADLFINPLEHSYTVESLEALAAGCGLELLMPCISTYAKFLSPALDWNLRFTNPELQSAYDSLPDTRRWQVSNLLLHERSPLLWFYLQRADGGRPRKSEQQICEEFLERAFKPASARQQCYMRSGDEWALAPRLLPYPLEKPDPAIAEIYALAGPDNTMRRVFRYLGIEPTFQAVNEARLKLTTSAFPYLKAVK
jgi:SAM-dependent methyltransferase